MSSNQSNAAAFATPYFSETESRQVGKTSDSRAVWQSNLGPPFYIVHDTKGAECLLVATPGSYTELPHPHKTYAELFPPVENKTFVNTRFTVRNYDCINIVACQAPTIEDAQKIAPNTEWREADESEIDKLTKLYRQGNVSFYGYM